MSTSEFTPYTPTAAAKLPLSGSAPTSGASNFTPYTPGQTNPISPVTAPPSITPPTPTTGSAGQTLLPGNTVMQNIKSIPSQLYGAITNLLPGKQIGTALGNSMQGASATATDLAHGNIGQAGQDIQNVNSENSQMTGKVAGDVAQAVTLPLSLVMGGAGGSTGNATIDAALSKGTGSWWGKILNAGMKYAAAGGVNSGGATAAAGGNTQQTVDSTALGALGGFLGGGAGQTVDGAITGLRSLRNPETAAIAANWHLPALTNTSSFNKARDILANDPDIPNFLGELRANPAGHIANEKYDTADTANALRQTAGQMSRDVLRPGLQMADYYTPKTPVQDVVDSAIANIKDVPNTLAGDEKTIIASIQKEGQELAQRYPQGMSLTDMHDEGINYNQKGGYKPNGSDLDNNTATRNRTIGQTLKQQVESKAPATIPVHDFNQYLQKYYHAADYLDALNTKTAPKSLALKLANRGASVLGAVIGHGVGGGIIGGVGGYMMGGALEHAAENLSGKAAGSFFSNLEQTNPKAFQSVLDYLTKANAGETGLLALPPATSESPIPLGAAPDNTPVAPYAAKTPLPVANPKTGRMQTVYTSKPKT